MYEFLSVCVRMRVRERMPILLGWKTALGKACELQTHILPTYYLLNYDPSGLRPQGTMTASSYK